MATSREDMKELLEKMFDMPAYTAFMRERNDVIRKELQHYSVPTPKYDRVGGRGSGTGDPVSREAENRERRETELRINERAISERMSLHSRLSLIMAETLTDTERQVILAKHEDRLPWWKVGKLMKKGESSCKRIERAAMKKLCAAWDKKKEELEKRRV